MANTYVLHFSALQGSFRIKGIQGPDAKYSRYADHILYFINYVCRLMYQLQECAWCEYHRIRKYIIELCV